MKTYLYNRISSGKQNKGDGLQRQSQSNEVLEFIKKYKLNVVERMEYVGSSFSGKNFDNETVLGKFISDVKAGNIESPVCLCFENWDRFGRDVEWKNTKRFLDLIYAGVSIGVVSMDIIIDQKVLAENSNILQLVVNDIQRARKESQRKSGFSKRNILVKVTKAKAGGKIYFGGQSPRWIIGVENDQWVLDVKMVEEIKRIFGLYLNGKSCVGIAKILNLEKKETFGVSKKNPTNKVSKVYWFNTTVRNLLTHKSLTGWCRIGDFESNNYYPSIIDEQTFNRVQSRLELNAINRGGSRTGKVTNLFTGMTRCKCCGNDIGVRYHKVGNVEYSYMGCRKSQVRLCKDTTNWRTDKFEELLFGKLFQKSPTELLVKKSDNSTLVKLQTDLAKVNIVIRRLTDLASDPELKDVTELQNNLTKAIQQREIIRSNIQQEETKQATVKANPASILKLVELFKNSKSTVTTGDGITESIVLFPSNPKEAIEQYNQLVKTDRNTIRTALQDNNIRIQLRAIMPDLISGIQIDLAGKSFVVTTVNGSKKEIDYK